MKQQIFSEIGFGNSSFFSTEFENSENEFRVESFIKPKKIKSYYLRFWILKKVFIFDTKELIKIKNKNKNKFKLLFGIRGE